VGGVLVNDAEEEAEAAAGRRAQLGIKEPAATEPPVREMNGEPPEIDPRGMDAATESDTGRLVAGLEAKIAALEARNAELTRLAEVPWDEAKPIAAQAEDETEAGADDAAAEVVQTKGQKAWQARKQRANRGESQAAAAHAALAKAVG
jgi:hypothetical protein